MKIIAAGLLLMNVAFGQTQLRSLRAVPVPACATCHFHAGADHRPQNTLVDPNSPFRVNVELSTVLVRLYLLSHPGNRNSTMVRDSGVRVGSAGTFRRIFEGIVPGQAGELGRGALDKPEFMRGDFQVRRV